MKRTVVLLLVSLVAFMVLVPCNAVASPSSDNYVDAGFIALKSGNNELAEKLFTRALDYDQNSALAWAGLGKAKWRGSMFYNDESHELFNKSLACDDADSEEWIEVFMIFYEEPVQDYEYARQAALKAVEADPENDDAWNKLGVALDWLSLERKADFNDSFEAFNKALNLNPTVKYSYNTGYSAIVIGNYSYAIEVSDRAVKSFNPDDYWKGNLLLVKGWALAENGESEAALETLAESRKVHSSEEFSSWGDTESVVVSAAEGIALNNLGRYDESIEILERVDIDKVWQYCKEKILTPEQYLDVYGVALEGAGRTDEARSAFEEALRLNPEYAPAKEHLEKLTTSESG